MLPWLLLTMICSFGLGVYVTIRAMLVREGDAATPPDVMDRIFDDAEYRMRLRARRRQ